MRHISVTSLTEVSQYSVEVQPVVRQKLASFQFVVSGQHITSGLQIPLLAYQPMSPPDHPNLASLLRSICVL
jgi:hypothetical protein